MPPIHAFLLIVTRIPTALRRAPATCAGIAKAAYAEAINPSNSNAYGNAAHQFSWPAGAKKPGYRIDLRQAADVAEPSDYGYPAPALRAPRPNQDHVIREAAPVGGATIVRDPPPASIRQGGCGVCGQVHPLGAPIRPQPDAAARSGGAFPGAPYRPVRHAAPGIRSGR